MKKADKILLFIVSLAGIGCSVCIFSLFYPIPFVTGILYENQAYYPWIDYIIAGYNAFIGMCFFVLLLAALLFPSRSNFLIIEKAKGKIQFSKKTIESAVRYSFLDINGISTSEIRAKLHKHPDKTKIFVKLFLNNSSELIDLTETVQNRIEASLQSSLGISVKSITIKVVSFNPNDTAKDEDKKDAKKESRVI